VRPTPRYQAALGSGADPAVVIQWINYAQVTDSVVVAQGHLVVQLSGGGR
jgi:hypothetical protein